MDEETLRRVVMQLLAAQRKIEAVKLVRTQTGLGLAESKAFVEAIQAGHSPGLGAQVAPAAAARARRGSPEEVAEFVRAGRLIDAIKLHREITGLGLAEAKRQVEAMAERMTRGGDPPMQPAPAERVQTPPGGFAVQPSIGAAGLAPFSARTSQPAFAARPRSPDPAPAAKPERPRFSDDDSRHPGDFPVALFVVAVSGALAAGGALVWLFSSR